MTNDQYQATQDIIVNIFQQLAVYDLDICGFINQISQAEGACPILDPTLWMQGSRNLGKIKEMAEALRPAVLLVRKWKEEVRKP